MKPNSIFKVLTLVSLLFCLGTRTASAEDDEYMVDSIRYVLLPYHGDQLSACVRWGYPHNGHISIPDTVEIEEKSYPVTSIFISAFKGGDIIRSITLPNTLELISPYAFQGTGIDSIAIPMNVNVEDACFDRSTIKIVKFVDNPYQESDYCQLGSNCFNVHELDRVEIDSCGTLTLYDTGGFVKQLWLKGINTLSLRNKNGNLFTYRGLSSVRLDSPVPPQVTGWEETEQGRTCLSKILLFVPDESISAYKSAFFWKEFYEIYPISRITELDELISKASIEPLPIENGICHTTGNGRLILNNLMGQTFEVYDMAGQLVKTVKGRDSVEVKLAKGIYLVVGKNYRRKVVL